MKKKKIIAARQRAGVNGRARDKTAGKGEEEKKKNIETEDISTINVTKRKRR